MEWLDLIGFSQSQDDPCLFRFQHTANEYIIIALPIDDFLIAATSRHLLDWLATALAVKYPGNVKRLGFPSSYFGWTIAKQTDSGIKISQPNYAAKALSMMRMT